MTNSLVTRATSSPAVDATGLAFAYPNGETLFEGPEQRLPADLDATAVLVYGPRAGELSGSVVNIVDTVPAITTEDYRVLVTVPDDQATRLYDELLGTDPSINVEIGGAATVAGASELDNILDVFRWGAGFAVAASFVAALFSLVSLLHDRQSANNYLQILGLNPRQTAVAAVGEVGTAAGLIVATALFGSWIWALSFSIDSDNDFVGFVPLIAPFVTTLLALLMGAGAIIWTTLRNASVSVVPDRDGLVSAHDVFDTEPATA